MGERLLGKRVLVTNADRYGGPPVCELFAKEGAEVIADTSDYLDPETPRRVVSAAGHIDVLVANFAGPLRIMPFTSMLGPVQDAPEADFRSYLDELTWPFIRFIQATLPQMIERRQGKIVGITSAATLRAIPGLAVYTAARGAQNAFVMCVGAEVAPHNVQVNAIAPAFFENNTYFTPEMLADPAMRQALVEHIPAGRIGEGFEGAELVLSLSGDASNFLAGQVIAFSGGWAT
jgi:2-keto-3-deoxy-L-fuconate dehydrogenase